MKYLKSIIINAIAFCLGMLLAFVLNKTIHDKPTELKEGNIVILGDNCSIKLAEPSDLDNNDTIGIIVKNNEIYHKGIKVEVGQEWTYYDNNPFEDNIVCIITDIKDGYIQYVYYNGYSRRSESKNLFFGLDPKLTASEKGYYTVNGVVKNINTTNK